MDQGTNRILFSLLRSAIRGMPFEAAEHGEISPDKLGELMQMSSKHDVDHLVALALKQSALSSSVGDIADKTVFRAVYRYRQLKYEYDSVCAALEEAQIPFIPLKGSVLRAYYPEPWMRTSCDIDVLVHTCDLDAAINCLTEKFGYEQGERGTHDIALQSPSGVHVELHFDLVEEGRANNAIEVLSSVWDNVSLHEGYNYRYDMSDAFFYFYHIAHMAKHFENGGCGIRPFIDLWILDHTVDGNKDERDALLERGELLAFANVSRALSEVWIGGCEADALTLKMQDFLLHGGAFGSSDNRVAIQQKKKGGRFGYLMSRIFVPTAKLKRYYPILERHPWLMPVMQVRRWFMLLDPEVAKMARSELTVNRSIDSTKSAEMNAFLTDIGL